jgi:UDP:flavonoid glycosyltransferase YjiC (YdhE family)
VTIPVFADHPFWARRLAELKLGSKPIPRSRLTRDRLVGAIKAATEDGGLSDNAAQFRPLIQAETGVQNAVNIIQHYLARG